MKTWFRLKQTESSQESLKGQVQGRKTYCGVCIGKRFFIQQSGHLHQQESWHCCTKKQSQRLIRESYRLSEDSILTGYDIVILVKSTVRAAKTPNNRLKAVSLPSFHDIDSEFKKLGMKLGIFKKEESD